MEQHDFGFFHVLPGHIINHTGLQHFEDEN